MSNAVLYDANMSSGFGGQSTGSGDQPPLATFEVVPSTQPDMESLYSFRVAMQPPPEVNRIQQRSGLSVSVARVLMLFALLAGAALVVLAFPNLFHSSPPAPYIDLGSQRFDSAGLSGRLIGRWQTGASYELFLDPQSQDQVAGFAAVAQVPPRQLAVTLRLRDAAGLVTCQKQILFPAPALQTPGAKPVDALAPEQTQSGDTVQNMTGPDGQISEIDLSGPLPCSAKAYAASRSWDFATDFPSLAEQRAWPLHLKGLGVKIHARSGVLRSQVLRLPAPIEGNDMIVGENPSRGTVETSAGRVFYLGAAGMRNRTAEWQVFPSSIYFRCQKTGMCILTHSASQASLQARLLK